MNETPTTDEEKYLEYGRALRSAVDEAISPWLTSTLQERNNGQALPAEIVDAIAEVRMTALANICLLYTSPSPRDATLSRMPSSA